MFYWRKNKMKASEMIEQLQQLIKENGDCNIYYWDEEKITGFDSVDIIEVRKYGFGNDAKIFYIE
jgi:hypothetical protein